MEVIKKPDPKFAYWHGIPREEIPWYPTIDEDKCIGCKLCFVTCGRNVFSIDTERHKAVVVRPYNCMVGCSTCATICPTQAISFPDREVVYRVEREHRILGRIQKKARAKMTRQEYESARIRAMGELEKATFRVKYTVAGHILERNLVQKMLDFIEDKPIDIVDMKLHTPTIKGCWNEKAPSYLEFVVTSTGDINLDDYLTDIDKVIEGAGCVIINRDKV